jgi:WD40 repeat protein
MSFHILAQAHVNMVKKPRMKLEQSSYPNLLAKARTHFKFTNCLSGYSSLTLDSTKSKLFGNCTNDVIYMYDCVTYPMNPSATFRGHSNATFYIKSCVSPDDQYLMSGSGDCDGYIWRIDDPTAAPFHLIGHANEVTCVAWCPKDQTKVELSFSTG